jgi:hypothetical protein
MSDAILPIILILAIYYLFVFLPMQRMRKRRQAEPSAQGEPGRTTLVECPACKRSVSAEAIKCPQCGHPFPMRPKQRQVFVAVGFIVIGIVWVMYLGANPHMIPQDQVARNAPWILILIGMIMLVLQRFGKL